MSIREACDPPTVARQVGSEDCEPLVSLQPLQQVADLEVCVPVVRVLHFSALPEQGVGLIEEQYVVGGVGRIGLLIEVLFGLTHVLVHHVR